MPSARASLPACTAPLRCCVSCAVFCLHCVLLIFRVRHLPGALAFRTACRNAPRACVMLYSVRFLLRFFAPVIRVLRWVSLTFYLTFTNALAATPLHLLYCWRHYWFTCSVRSSHFKRAHACWDRAYAFITVSRANYSCHMRHYAWIY